MPLTLGAVYGEARALYRLLMRRSILTAFLVFAAVDGVGQLSRLPASTAARVVLGLLSFVLTFSAKPAEGSGRSSVPRSSTASA